MKNHRDAFTLIEVVALLGLMSILLMSGFRMVELVRVSDRRALASWKHCRDALRLSEDFRRDVRSADGVTLLPSDDGVELVSEASLIRYRIEDDRSQDDDADGSRSTAKTMLRRYRTDEDKFDDDAQADQEYELGEKSRVTFSTESLSNEGDRALSTLVRIAVALDNSNDSFSIWAVFASREQPDP